MGKKFGGFGGGANMNNMIKQAQKMQQDMQKIQEELEERTVEATSGGGVVKVIASCKKNIKEITIDKTVVDPDDVETLEDLILTAVNAAITEAEKTAEREMSKLTGGINMPGLF